MGWKIEKWLEDVFSASQRKFEDYHSLRLREMVITACAVLDVALAELISLRLTGPVAEIIDFVGADEDGRAPAGSFGSRIQLARLLGLLSDEEMRALRALKQLRNVMAHRVNAELSSTKVQAALEGVWNAQREQVEAVCNLAVSAACGEEASVEALCKLRDYISPRLDDDDAAIGMYGTVTSGLALFTTQIYGGMNEVDRAKLMQLLSQNKAKLVKELIDSSRLRLLTSPGGAEQGIWTIMVSFQSRFRYLHGRIQRVSQLPSEVDDFMRFLVAEGSARPPDSGSSDQ